MDKSLTFLAIGPGVSVEATGITPDVLINPSVGFRPTIPLTEAGEIIEPKVSVPIETVHKLEDTLTAEPELEPDGVISS